MTEDVAFVDECVKKHGKFLIPVLQDMQERYNYLPEELLREVAEKLERPLRDVYGVATFYRAFSLTPKGKHIVTVCLGTACHVRGGARVADTLARELGIELGETTEDMQFTLETVNCLGCCAIGPIVVVNGEYYRMVTNRKAVAILRNYMEGS
jgi:NADH-quinone oxidoreductase subunit E